MRDEELSRLTRGFFNIPPEIKEWVRQRLVSLVRLASLARPSAARDDEVAGFEADARDGGAASRRAQRFQHYGFRSQPGEDAQVVLLQLSGGANNLVSVASEAPGTGPTDQGTWEVEIYHRDGHRLRMRNDGSIRMEVVGGSVLELRADGSVALQDATGGQALLKTGRLALTHDLQARHVIGKGMPPVVQPAGAVVINGLEGTDAGCVVRFTVPNLLSGTIFNLTWAAPWPATPIAAVALSASSPAVISWTTTATGLTLTGTAVVPGTYAANIVTVGAP